MRLASLTRRRPARAAALAVAPLLVAGVVPAMAATLGGSGLSASAASLPASATRTPITSAAPKHAIHRGAGFDGCQGPDTGSMRAWLASPYRAMNIYIGGSQLAKECRTKGSELDTTRRRQWVRTVTSNGWALIPTFVDLQPPCLLYSHKKTFTAATARSAGRDAANRAVDQMKSFGFPAGNPVYVDFEHYDQTRRKCVAAAVDFAEAWTKRVRALHYRAGLYAVDGAGLEPIATQASPRPDAIWWARWDGRAVTGTHDLHGHWKGHRIHQYRGDHYETYAGVSLQIDNDQLAGDVVGAVAPPKPTAPYVYRASPPVGSTLKARSGPRTGYDVVVEYAYSDPITITCQAAGQTIHGDYVWDELADGTYVSDLYTTTAGRRGFAAGLPRCDTTGPVTTMATTSPVTLAERKTFAWSATDPAAGGQRGSGIASYDARWRRASWSGGFGSWHKVRHLDSGRLSLPLAAGDDYCVEGRATDRSGNTGHWSAPACTARALDDRSLHADASWQRRSDRHAYLGTLTTAAASGARLTRKGAVVRRIAVVAKRCPSCGTVKVKIGSTTVGVVDLSGSAAEHRIYQLPTFPLRSGKVRLVTTSGASVRIDGLVLSRS